MDAVANFVGANVGANANQRALLDAAIPTGISAEQDMIRDIALSSYDYYISTFTGGELTVNAVKALDFAKAVGKTVTLSQNNMADVNTAYTNVTTVLDTIVGDNSLVALQAADAVIDTIVSDSTVSYAQQVFKAIAKASFRVGNAVASSGPQQVIYIKEQLNNIINNALPPASIQKGPIIPGAVWDFPTSIQSRSFPNPIYIGSVKTLSGRVGATQAIDNAIRSIDTATAQLNGQKNALNSAKATLDVLVTELSAAADNYLSADYEKIIPELTQLLREAKVLSLAFGLSERQINTVISQMESAAAAA